MNYKEVASKILKAVGGDENDELTYLAVHINRLQSYNEINN